MLYRVLFEKILSPKRHTFCEAFLRSTDAPLEPLLLVHGSLHLVFLFDGSVEKVGRPLIFGVLYVFLVQLVLLVNVVLVLLVELLVPLLILYILD